MRYVRPYGLICNRCSIVADTVKTMILKEIQNRLLELPDLASLSQVKRWEDIPADFSTIPLPAVFFWETERKEPWNRLSKCILDFWLEVFFPLDPDDPASFTDFSEEAAIMDAQIEGLFHNLSGLRSLGLLEVRNPTAENAKYMSERAAFFKNYELVYVHATGDPFRVTP